MTAPRRMGVVRAIKVIKRELVNSPDTIARFHREVLAAAQLSHQHIVMAHDAGEDQGRHFLVMEYIDGPDLGSLVKQRGALPVQVAIDFIIQGARGLAHAHSKGTIHRDVKPGNFLLASDGVVKVSDLGLARLDPDKSPVDNDTYLTTSDGRILGTVDFMAPEQAEDTHTADHRADIYSLGCTLYRLLTGESPYGKGSTIQRMMAHQTAPIPKIRDKFPEVPQWIDAAFARMVAKRPADRPQSMDEVIELLTASIETVAAPAAKPPVAKVSGGKSAPQRPIIHTDAQSTRRLSGTQKLKQQAQTLLRSKHGVPIIAGGIVLLLAFVAVTLAMIMLTIQTPEGEFVVQVDGQIAPDVKIELKQGGEVIEVASAKNGWKLSVNQGEYQLAVQGGNDQFQLDKYVASVTRDGKEIVRLSRKQTLPPPPDHGGSPPPSPEPDNYALSFEGERSFVELPLTYDSSHAITIEATVTLREIEDCHVLSNKDCSLFVGRPSNTRVYSWWFGGMSGGVQLFVGEPILDQSHVRLCGVYDGELKYLFIDGKRVRDLPMGKFRRGIPQSIWLGATRDADGKPTRFLNGTIDEVRISNVARYTEDYTPQDRLEADEHTLALYHFDEGTGDKLIDSSGNNHHGKIHGAKWVRVGQPQQNYALDFDDNDMVKLPLKYGGGPITIEATARPTNNLERTVITCLSQLSGMGLSINGNRNWMATILDPAHLENPGMLRHSHSENVAVLGSQTKLAVVYDGQRTMHLFVDGVRQPSTTAMGAPCPASNIPFTIGRANNDGWNFLGTIDEVRISNVARYTEDYTPQERLEADEHTLALYHFDEGAGDILKDSSGDNHHGKIHGAKWVRVDGSSSPTPTDQIVEVRKLVGPEGPTRSCAISQDGNYAISGGGFPDDRSDRTLRYWNLKTGDQVWTRKLQEAILAVAISPDGELAATGGRGADSVIRIWDLRSGKQINSLSGHRDHIFSLAFSPDGQLLLSAGGGRIARLWNIGKGTEIGRFVGHTSRILSVAFLSDGKQVVTAGKTVRVWNVRTGDEIRQLDTSSSEIESLAVSPHHEVIATGGIGGLVELWNSTTGEKLRTWGKSGGDRTVTLAFTHDGRHLIRGLVQSQISILSVDDDAPIQTVTNPGGVVYDIDVLPSGREILVASAGEEGDYALRLWRLPESVWPENAERLGPPAADPDQIVEVRRFEGHQGPILGPHFVSPDGSLLFSQGGADGLFAAFNGKRNRVKIWDVATGNELRNVTMQKRGAGLSLSPNGRLFTVTEAPPGHTSGTLTLYSVDDPEPKWRVKFENDAAYGAQFSRDGEHLLTYGLGEWNLNHGIRVSAVETGREIWRRDFDRGTWLPHSKIILARNSQSTELHLLDATNGEEAGRLKQNKSEQLVNEVFDATGRYVVAGTNNGTVIVWDLEEQRELHRHKVGTGQIRVAGVPDNGHVLVIDEAHIISVRELASGDEVARMRGHSGHITSLNVIPGDQYAISGSVDNTMRLWDIRTGEEIAHVNADAIYVRNITVLPDGKHVITSEGWGTLETSGGGHEFANTDHALRLWRLPERVWPENNRTPQDIVDDGALLLMNFEQEHFAKDDDGQLWVRDLSGNGNHGRCDKVQYTPDGKAGGALECVGGGQLKLSNRVLDDASEYTIFGFVRKDEATASEAFYAECHENGLPDFVVSVVTENRRLWVAEHDGGWHNIESLPSDPGKLQFLCVRRCHVESDDAELIVTLEDNHSLHKSIQRLPAEKGHTLLGIRMRGLMDEVAIFDRALTDYEIRTLREHVESGKPLPTPGSKPSSGTTAGGGAALPARDVDEIVGDGAILRLTFEEETLYKRGGETYFRDLSGRGNDARCMDGASLLKNGRAGAGVDCAKGHLRLPAPLLAGLADYTIAGWVKVSAAAYADEASMPLFHGEYGSDRTQPWSLFGLTPDRRLRVKSFHGGWKEWSTPPAALPQEGWVFIAYTLQDGGKAQGRLRLAVDDKSYQTTLQAVGEHYGFTELGYGAIDALDELVVFNRALSESELTVLREHGRAGKPLPSPKETSTSQPQGE